MVLLEAMSTGLPVIASAVGEIPRIIVPGVCGWLTRPGDSSSLVQAISEALSPRLASMGTGVAARERVVSEFSSMAMARRYLDIYEAVCRR